MDTTFRYSLSPANLAALARLGADCAEPFWIRLGMDDFVRQLIVLAGEGYECVLIAAPHPDGTAAYTLSGRGWTIVKAMWREAARTAKQATDQRVDLLREVAAEIGKGPDMDTRWLRDHAAFVALAVDALAEGAAR